MSRGVREEIDVAEMNRIPVEYLDPEDAGIGAMQDPAERAPVVSVGEGKESNPNPKDGIGATKLPLSLVPATAVAVASLAHLDGATRYGAWNWRAAGVRASVYLDALARHVARWQAGEELDPDSGVPHLGHAIACLNILVDAQACGRLADDRPPSVDITALFQELTPNVARLKQRNAGANPRHYTIADGKA